MLCDWLFAFLRETMSCWSVWVRIIARFFVGRFRTHSFNTKFQNIGLWFDLPFFVSDCCVCVCVVFFRFSFRFRLFRFYTTGSIEIGRQGETTKNEFLSKLLRRKTSIFFFLFSSGSLFSNLFPLNFQKRPRFLICRFVNWKWRNHEFRNNISGRLITEKKNNYNVLLFIFPIEKWL